MNINYDYTQSLGPIIGIPLIMILYNDNRNRSESRRCVTGGSQWRSPKWTSFGRRLQRLRTGGQAGTCRDPGVTSASGLGEMDLVFLNIFCSFFKLEGIGHEKYMTEIWQTYQVQFLFLTSHARQDLHDVLLPALGCPGSQMSVLNGKMGDLGLRLSGTWDGRWFWSTQGNRTGLWSRESSFIDVWAKPWQSWLHCLGSRLKDRLPRPATGFGAGYCRVEVRFDVMAMAQEKFAELHGSAPLPFRAFTKWLAAPWYDTGIV